MTFIIVFVHLCIVILSSLLVYYSGMVHLRRDDKYAVYAWMAFIFFVLVLTIYMTYHCFDVIAYYGECVWN